MEWDMVKELLYSEMVAIIKVFIKIIFKYFKRILWEKYATWIWDFKNVELELHLKAFINL